MSSMKFMTLAGLAILAAANSLPLAPAAAQDPAQPLATITVANVQVEQGVIIAALYDEGGWGRTPVTSTRAEASVGQVTLLLSAPAPGRYGVRLFHDVDGDGKLAANLMGMPTEPFGISNDAPIRFGPPTFADAAFDIGESGASQTITLR
jgi:uncharacterized protein (DUF2141 family)